MKIVLPLALLLSVFTVSCIQEEVTGPVDFPLGTFNFDFARLGSDEASQIKELESIGYGGLVMNLTNPKELKTLQKYQAAVGDGAFNIYAAYVVVDFAKDLAVQDAYLDKVIQSLKQSESKLWVILRVRDGKTVEHEQIVNFLRSTAKRAKAGGTELVIYPHYSGNNPNNICLIESAEDAIPFVEEIGSDNLFISLHLCHEIKAGNGDRLDEVAAKIKPWLRLPSINGSDIDAVNEVQGWDRGIQPLTQGNYDASKLLSALNSVGYEGPVILHTWGLQDEAADHHHTSYDRFQEMLKEQ
ncbi:TIM barrel protein [Pelagicoccus mobilis]|uniref:Sugar phosphate isomerase/epimerase n=1 Tax=Pelagicoccus mobilis TaxID=415221 RepID=A0A934RTS2_9BACT|nr:TIM barrel protein [Pelagicoccus mobilis]MBK1877465.1 sugar phosphate isomerase/epimerase [Pelagicoccus mobilis]